SLEFSVAEKNELESRGRDGLADLLNRNIKDASNKCQRIMGGANGQEKRDLTPTEACRVDELLDEVDTAQEKLDAIMVNDVETGFEGIAARPRKTRSPQVGFMVNGPYPPGM